jgi:hypothetical protein
MIGIQVEPFGDCLIAVGVLRDPSHERRQAGKGVYVDADGYPKVWHQGRQWLAHRLVWTLVHGPIDDGLEIHHRCRRRSCMNEGHMVALSHRAHMAEDARLRRLASENPCKTRHTRPRRSA